MAGKVYKDSITIMLLWFKMAENDLDLDKTKLYEETYKLRGIGGGFSISVPKVVVKRKAKEKNMTVEEFKEKYKVKVYFDGLTAVDGAFEFVKKEKKGGGD